MSSSPNIQNAVNAIEAARAIGLSLLKPSKRDLEYGLALHQKSLVIESYGLGLQAPVEPEAVSELLRQGASEAELQELLENTASTRWTGDKDLNLEYRLAWKSAGVTCTFQSAGEESNDPLRLLRRVARYTFIADSMPSFFKRVTSPSDIVTARHENRHCLCLSTNGVPLAGRTHTTIDELSHLEMFAQLGVRMMHLTYNRRNLMGDGCSETSNAGLSDFGQAAVKQLNRLGILVDLAHAGWQTSIDAARISDRPVIISHAAAWSLNQHMRCKPDDVIDAVLDSGGAIGVTNVPAFLGGTSDISAFLDHIDYIAGKFGANGIVIGTDQAYRAANKAVKDPQIKLPLRRSRWEHFWSQGIDLTTDSRAVEKAASLAWTNWPLFTVGLVQRGYSDEDIAAILGGNMLRIIQQTWPSSLPGVSELENDPAPTSKLIDKQAN